MVSSTLKTPLGTTLLELDKALETLGMHPLEELTTSQRRVISLLLKELNHQAAIIVSALSVP